MELNKQLENAEEENQYKMHELNGIKQECEELEAEIAHYNQLQSTARKEANDLKKKAKDLKDQLDTSAWALEEAQVEEERLRSQVVTSPDRRKNELVERRERLNMMKQECEELENEIQVSKTKNFRGKQIAKELEQACDIMGELQEQIRKNMELTTQLEEVNSTIEATEKQTVAFEQATDEAERELHRAEEKIVLERNQQKLSMEAMHEALEAAKSQLLDVEKDRRDGMARVEAGEAEVRELEAEMEKERIKTDQEIAAMIEEYQELEKLFLERNAKIMAVITN